MYSVQIAINELIYRHLILKNINYNCTLERTVADWDFKGPGCAQCEGPDLSYSLLIKTILEAKIPSFLKHVLCFNFLCYFSISTYIYKHTMLLLKYIIDQGHPGNLKSNLKDFAERTREGEKIS